MTLPPRHRQAAEVNAVARLLAAHIEAAGLLTDVRILAHVDGVQVTAGASGDRLAVWSAVLVLAPLWPAVGLTVPLRVEVGDRAWLTDPGTMGSLVPVLGWWTERVEVLPG